MSRLNKRLERLEERTLPLDLPDWPIEDQVIHVVEALHLHRIAGTVQLASDREIHLVATLIAEGG